MSEIYSNSYLINDLHFYTGDLGEWIPGAKYAFFINSTVFAKWKNMFGLNLKHDVIWDFRLQVGNKFYDTKLIFLTIDDEEIFDFMQEVIWTSPFSFPWEDRSILYKSSNQYHKLEEFINLHNLNSDIEKIEEIESVSDDGVKIKVISFASYIDKTSLFQKYRQFISKNRSVEPTYYYFTAAFPWYQQPLLEHFEIPLENEQINSVFPIILRHLYYSDAINIFDLIAIKLAICDFRNSHHSNLLKDEIDTLIQLSLQKMATTKTYIKNNVFDLVQYSMDRNFIPNKLCILYFVYTFQNYFNSVRIVCRDEIMSRPGFLNLPVLTIPIKLTEQFDEIRKIRDRSNIKFKIDGNGFDKMTIPLFLDLIEHNNVDEIVLDTNYAWSSENNEAMTNKTYQINDGKKIKVKLIGTNSLNFMEEFVGFLKTFRHSNKLILTVLCPLNSYMIFDNLEIRSLIFCEIHIDHKLLNDLARCNFKFKSIAIEDCTLENKIENWQQMIRLKQLWSIQIKEEESTWQFLFDYISNCFSKESNMTEFKFNKIVRVGQIDFEEIRFTMDESNSKLLLKDLNSQQIFDLYELKYRDQLVENNDVDYDFYQ